MKVVYEKSITFKVLERVKKLSGDVILRSDIANIADPREISRALNRLVSNGYLVNLSSTNFVNKN